MNVEYEKLVFATIRKFPERYITTVQGNWFTVDAIKYLFHLVKEHYSEYTESPTDENIYAQIRLNQNDGKVNHTIDELGHIISYSLKNMSSDYVQTYTDAWIVQQHFEFSVNKALAEYKQAKTTPENIKELVAQFVNSIISIQNMQLDSNLGTNLYDADAYLKPPGEIAVPTGYVFFDFIKKGGFSRKTINVFLGGQNSGKSMWLCNMAANYIRLGYNVLYISLEMSEFAVLERIARNLFHMNTSSYMDLYNESRARVKDIIGSFKNSNGRLPGELRIKQMPTGMVNVSHIQAYIKKFESETSIKSDVVIIDYLGCMRPGRHIYQETQYHALKTISEELRGMAINLDVCLLTAAQTTRNAATASDITDSDIAESYGMMHVVDSVLGIIQDKDMQEKSIYRIKNIKNRDGGFKNSYATFKFYASVLRIDEDYNYPSGREIIAMPPDIPFPEEYGNSGPIPVTEDDFESEARGYNNNSNNKKYNTYSSDSFDDGMGFAQNLPF